MYKCICGHEQYEILSKDVVECIKGRFELIHLVVLCSKCNRKRKIIRPLVCDLTEASTGNIIMGFDGPYSFLSNFYPVQINMGDFVFPSVEHAYQAGKTDDPDMRSRIARMSAAGDAKWQGKHLIIIPGFEQNKIEIMGKILRIKFSNKEFKEKLLDTGNMLIFEYNMWEDVFWGIIQYDSLFYGENYLGRLLMEIRDEISKE